MRAGTGFVGVAVVALSGCCGVQQPDLSAAVIAAASAELSCPIASVRIRARDYNGLQTDDLYQVDACGQFRVFRNAHAFRTAVRDATDEVRAQSCSGQGRWYASNAVRDAARITGCPEGQIQILGTGWFLYAEDTYELMACGQYRLFTRLNHFGPPRYGELTTDPPPRACVPRSAPAPVTPPSDAPPPQS